MTNECIIITGGTRGIGLATAIRYTEQNINIILTYKSNLKFKNIAESKLKKIHNNFYIIMCDPDKKEELNKLKLYI